MIKEDYLVKLTAFEGPLDLLLWLVQNNNMDIYDIEISRITSQYLLFIGQRSLNLDDSADFISMASLLLRIKSKLMLPRETEEHQEAEEMKRDLSERLMEWKKIKDSRQILLEKHQSRKNFFRREEPAAVEIDKKSTLTIFELADIFANLVKNNDKNFDTISGPQIYLEDVIIDIEHKIRIRGKLKLTELVRANPTRLYVAVLILAILELSNKRTVYIKQDRPFEEVYLTGRFEEDSVPEMGNLLNITTEAQNLRDTENRDGFR